MANEYPKDEPRYTVAEIKAYLNTFKMSITIEKFLTQDEFKVVLSQNRALDNVINTLGASGIGIESVKQRMSGGSNEEEG